MTTHQPATRAVSARLWESRGRLRLEFRARGYERWGELIADFRRTFVAGRCAHWLRGGQCWSVQMTQRERLMEFCETWRIDVVEEERE